MPSQDPIEIPLFRLIWLFSGHRRRSQLHIRTLLFLGLQTKVCVDTLMTTSTQSYDHSLAVFVPEYDTWAGLSCPASETSITYAFSFWSKKVLRPRASLDLACFLMLLLHILWLFLPFGKLSPRGRIGESTLYVRASSISFCIGFTYRMGFFVE